MTTRTLTYPLPARTSDRTQDGFSSRPWAIPDSLRALSSGGWFAKETRYDFASREAATFASNANAFFSEARIEVLRKERRNVHA